MFPSLEKKRRFSLSKASQKHKKLRKIQIGLVLLGCSALITVIAWPYLKEEAVFLSVKKSGLNPFAGEIDFGKKQLVNPRFEGEDEQKRPYVLQARLATQQGEDKVDLVEPKGTLTLTSGENVTIVSKKGDLTQNNTHLFLEGDVVLQGNGCTTSTNQAEADFKTNEAQGSQPVTSTCEQGIITGIGFVVKQEEGSILYKGRPHMILRLKKRVEKTNEKK